MILKCLGSSSRGNCYILEAADETLIVEAGIPMRDIKKGLGWQLGKVVGCLVSHRHEDHARSLNDFLTCGIRVLALADVFDATPTIAANTEYIALGEQIAKLEKEVSQPIAAAEDDFLREGRNSLVAGIDTLKSRQMKREQIEKNNQRIAELEKSLRMQSEELAQLEGIEFTMAAFSKARTEAIESKINGLFDFVKFRLFETQINGGEVETCEAMVNGVPFSDANTAGQFNAGIDIINAICRFEGISAPIFADGSESVNTLHPTQSQVIRLFVSLDDKLVIKHNGKPAQPQSLFN